MTGAPTPEPRPRRQHAGKGGGGPAPAAKRGGQGGGGPAPAGKRGDTTGRQRAGAPAASSKGGAPAASGKGGAPAASGKGGAQAASGKRGAPAASGKRGAQAASGKGGAAAAQANAPRERPPQGVRDVALAALRRVDEGAWANLVLGPVLARSGLGAQDRAAVTDLVYGTVRMRGALDAALEPRSRQPLERLEPLVLRGLRLGAYELEFARTAAHAAVAEVVGAVRRAGGPGPAGYVNAVLRRLAADPPSWPDPAADPLAWATTYGSHPAWVARQALARLGGDGLVRLVQADNRRPTVTLRATPGLATAATLVDELAAAGVEARPTALSGECVELAGGDPGALACVREGRAVVQDEGSALVAPALGARPGDLVADLAAGPGGKAGHLAALGARVLAVDLYPARAAKVAETADRIGVRERMLVAVADATRAPLLPGTADGVLVDAPCTNLGSLRRRPEARWRHQPEEVGDLVRLQSRLLDAAALAVRPGGSVLYSVCTWTTAETDEVVAAARSRLPQLEPAPLGGPLGGASQRQLWPHLDGTDGIFLARFVRRA